YLFDEIRDLINGFSIRTSPASPLLSIHRAKFAIFISPFIPNAHAVFFQVSNICFAFQKPKQFINDTFQMQLLCSDKWKSFLNIKPHLITKTTQRSCASTIGFFNTIIKYMLKKI